MIKQKVLTLLVLLITAVTGAWATITVTINQSDWGVNYSFTKDGVTVSAAYIDRDEGNIQGGGTFSTTLGNFTKIEVTSNYCDAYGTGWSSSGSSSTWAGTPASTVSFSGNFQGMDETQTTIVCTIEPATVAVTGVTLLPTTATLTVGETETVTLTATVLPGDATDKSVTWSSSDEAVATVSNEGVVTAVAAGEATITVTTTDGAKTATCTVTVAEPTYTVTVKEGTEDATSWQGKAGEGKYQQLPLEGVAQGAQVSLKYGGALKVKSVKAVKKAKPAATVTTAPTAKTGVKAGEDVAIVNEGAAEGGTMMYMVNATQPASTDGFSATVPTAEGLTAGTYYVWYYVKADDSHTDSEISASGIEVTIASAYTMAAAATSADKGKLICTDGHIHAYGADAACTKARVAKIIYIGTTGHATYSHGLALALTDEASTMAWQDAIDACSAKNTNTPVTGATWLQASYYQWGYMLGTNGAGSYDALRTGFTSVGGTDLQSDGYWSSTQSSDRQAYYFNFNKSDYFTGLKTYAKWVRACLAF